MLEGLFEALLVVLEKVADLGDLLLAEGDGLGLPRLERGLCARMNLDATAFCLSAAYRKAD